MNTRTISTLMDVPAGGKVRVHQLQSQPEVCQRLRELGFCEDAVVHCVLNTDEAMICEVCNTRIGLNHSIAKNILVAPFEHQMNQVSLNRLQPGERGRIERIMAPVSSVRQRLLEMGLTKGTVIEVIRFAPLGDPIEILVRGYRLSLRRVEAESVIVVRNK